MISSRGQYKFVAPPEWMEINGGILPARDVADDGSAAILRGEDACFLAEASFRAKLYRNYGTTYAVPSVGGEIDSAVVGGALSRIRDYPSHSYNYVKYAIPGTPAFEGSYVKDVGTGDVVQGVISSGVYLFSPATPSGPIPGPLDSDLMRRAYYDLRK
ncbi:MAG: hypothetical protein IIZ06_03820, partial [Kiritimatiellae bacterium]|nr:hypothetical protein [Kiritimatiellia bacterium]